MPHKKAHKRAHTLTRCIVADTMAALSCGGISATRPKSSRASLPASGPSVTCTQTNAQTGPVSALSYTHAHAHCPTLRTARTANTDTASPSKHTRSDTISHPPHCQTRFKVRHAQLGRGCILTPQALLPQCAHTLGVLGHDLWAATQQGLGDCCLVNRGPESGTAGKWPQA
jgi:hypothetical protein